MRRVIADLVNTPLAMRRDEAEILLRQAVQEENPPARMMVEQSENSSRPYALFEGVAIIPVQGTLVHGQSFWWAGETSYSKIADQMLHAMTDPEVRGVAMWVNSPGGFVSGCFDLADCIYDLRGEKPIWAFVDESAFSAAYALASSASRIMVPRTGGVGSVGVVAMHMDISKMLENMGVTVTTFQFGARKTDSYPTTPMTKEARTKMQEDIDILGEMFVDLVARNRGISKKAVRDTQAGCFLADEGIKLGLADAVMPIDEAFMEFVDTVKEK